MSKGNIPESDGGGEGPSSKRLREEGELPVSGTVRSRSGQGRYLTGFAPCPSAAMCRRTEHPLKSSDQSVQKKLNPEHA
ncbi:hypothetical protein AVEN_219701-1 [Araneus ventricosus]|uniref:Uncharacterized protein n=1 Tax=Araneus ventricosus TaxID=182803 RepID=A0A4Y2TK22_ARAVE|nr:hypothetical protein AVEN_240874-1 [Araneus ventricosus]GBO00949.1 hypothetical protein AVEN_219701-1 [Araneus ventricosus]